MSSGELFILKDAGGWIPVERFFEGDSAFKCLGLTRTQRLWGFVSCLVTGFALSITGAIVLLWHQWFSFAVLYSVGGFMSLVGTGFLSYPLNQFTTQIHLMCKRVRLVAFMVFVGSMTGVIVNVIYCGTVVRCSNNSFLVVEYIAYTVYSLSYIPHVRSAILKLVGLSRCY
ncbi:SFT2-domain-containing protein [Pisolithus marmoratus]|nr:SFT2-domain-containing protein [Pisolithus marmoratus]